MLWRKVMLSESMTRYLWLGTAILFSLHCEPESNDYSTVGDRLSQDSLSGNDCQRGEDGCNDVVEHHGDPSVVPEGSRVSCPGYKTNDNFPDSCAYFCTRAIGYQ